MMNCLPLECSIESHVRTVVFIVEGFFLSSDNIELFFFMWNADAQELLNDD